MDVPKPKPPAQKPEKQKPKYVRQDHLMGRPFSGHPGLVALRMHLDKKGEN